jgi:2-haloacid dehalogenase
MSELIAFDVNETLLDLKALDPHFARVFGDSRVRAEWFATVLRNSMVANITGRYEDFGKIAGASLDMTAEARHVDLKDEDRQAILGTVRKLPPHADVAPGLEKLRSAGLRMVTLTNSPPAVVEAQLKNAGLTAYFEKQLSVDAVRRYKPDAEVYRMAASQLGLPVDGIRLVAAHDWDVAGALNAGCKAAFIARPGKVLNPSMPKPDIVGADLIEVAEQILRSKP